MLRFTHTLTRFQFDYTDTPKMKLLNREIQVGICVCLIYGKICPCTTLINNMCVFVFSALFSQVAVLAAVLALVVIAIIFIIILIAVWRKVSGFSVLYLHTDSFHCHLNLQTRLAKWPYCTYFV